jgi:hypothetical protein
MQKVYQFLLIAAASASVEARLVELAVGCPLTKLAEERAPQCLADWIRTLTCLDANGETECQAPQILSDFHRSLP